jgi:hypothetical protein
MASAESSAGDTVAGSGGKSGTGGTGGTTTGPTLTFTSHEPLDLRRGDVATLTVEADPPGLYSVRFALLPGPDNTSPGDAALSRTDALTDAAGLVSVNVTVPNFPAWVCDMCGKREYDEQAASVLAMILNPEAGKPNRRIKRTPQPDTFNRNIHHPPSTNR